MERKFYRVVENIAILTHGPRSGGSCEGGVVDRRLERQAAEVVGPAASVRFFFSGEVSRFIVSAAAGFGREPSRYRAVAAERYPCKLSKPRLPCFQNAALPVGRQVLQVSEDVCAGRRIDHRRK
jgi:hypothetical protein